MQITTKTFIFNSNSLHILYYQSFFTFTLSSTILSDSRQFVEQRICLTDCGYTNTFIDTDKNGYKKILIKKAKVFR